MTPKLSNGVISSDRSIEGDVDLREFYVYDPTDRRRNGEVQQARSAIRTFEERFDRGQSVACIPLEQAVTLDHAAEFLNISLRSLDEIIAEGRLRFAGPSRFHIQFANLLQYRDEMRAARRQALEELSTIDRQLGLEG